MPASDDDATAKPERDERREDGERAAERVGERPRDRREDVERASERPAERASERPAERASERPAERASERASERPAERAPERAPERHAERPRERREERERDGDSLTETIRQRLEQLVPDLVKKTFAAGMGAVFQTEEGIRRLARESLPEVAGYIASSADGAKDRVADAKDRVFDVIARETREFLSNLNVSEEIAKILTTLSFEIKTEIRFIPNSERFTGAEPDVKASVRLKRAERDKDEDEDGGRRSRLRFWQRDRDRDGSHGGGGDRDEDDSSGEK
jgi:hypothetical protein